MAILEERYYGELVAERNICEVEFINKIIEDSLRIDIALS